MRWHEWLGAIGSAASLIGLVVTAFVLCNVRKLRSRYVKQAILTECASKPKVHRTNLMTARTKKNLSSIRRHLGKIKAVCETGSIHRGQAAGIEWGAVQLEEVHDLADSELLDKADSVLPILDELLERIELTITEMSWGNKDE